MDFVLVAVDVGIAAADEGDVAGARRSMYVEALVNCSVDGAGI
jgi:hypothetical protein